MNEPMHDLTAYRAAREAVAWASVSDHGWLRLGGRDRLDLLHRLSTNDLKTIAPGEGRPTVLTTATARITAVLVVYAGEARAYARTMPGQAPAVLRYLNSMIFWQDEVTPVDITAETAQFGLYGPGATDALAALTGRAAELPTYGWSAATIAGVAATVHRGGPLELPAWTIVAVREHAATLADRLSALGPQLDAAALEVLRVEAGLPAWGKELSDQVTPLETGLLAAISYNKGCYTGQEVIARQTNYDKVTRNLAGLIFPPGITPPPAGATVRGPGRGGFVGTAVISPALGRPVALAVIPRALVAPGTQVTVIVPEGEVTATVTSLPFIRG